MQEKNSLKFIFIEKIAHIKKNLSLKTLLPLKNFSH
jgi:hypothetical protein